MSEIESAPPANEPSPVAADSIAIADVVRVHKLRSQVKGAAWWLIAVAGFTLLNAINWLAQQNLRMIVGLISTRLLTFVAADAGAVGQVVLLVGAGAAALVFGVLGWLVFKGHKWALLTGILLYATDCVVFLVAIGTRDISGILFHGLALAFMISGYVAMRRLDDDPVAAQIVLPDEPVFDRDAIGGIPSASRIAKLALMVVGSFAVVIVVFVAVAYFTIR